MTWSKMTLTKQDLREAQEDYDEHTIHWRQRRDEAIYQAMEEGWTQRSIAKAMGISHGRVAQIALAAKNGGEGCNA